jgi:hypothetical protein
MLTPQAVRSRISRGETRDAGVSLIELAVAMTLMSIIGAMTLLFFTSMSTATTKTVDGNISTASARNALEDWTRLLSLADSPQTAGSGAGRFEQITATTAIFYANTNNNRATNAAPRTAPTKVFLALENGQLVERDYAPIPNVVPASYPATPTTTRYLATHVLLTPASPRLFTPYIAGSPPQLSVPNDCAGGTDGLCAGVPAADAILPTIIRVDVAFSVRSASGVQQDFASSAVITGGTT